MLYLLAVLAFIIGWWTGALTIALFAYRNYERGYQDALKEKKEVL
jgi:hypothetical protein